MPAKMGFFSLKDADARKALRQAIGVSGGGGTVLGEVRAGADP